MAFANYKEGKIFYKVAGKGRTIVLLHGFLESSAIWDDFANSLAKRYRVIAIDLPGHGQSDCFGYIHSMELMAEAVRVVLKKFQLRRIFIVGHSMGGYVTLAFSERYPEMIRGLCLFHSTVYEDTNERKVLRTRAIEIVKKNEAHYIRETIPNLFSKKFAENYPGKVTLIKHQALKTTRRGIIAAIEGMKNRKDKSRLLDQKLFPVFYIIGKLDNSISYESSLKQSDRIPDNQKLILEEVGHMGFLESSEKCLEAIKKFAVISFK